MGVLESYGEVLDASSINLIYQAEEQFLNPFPIFKFLDGDFNAAKILARPRRRARIEFEVLRSIVQKAMFWHAAGRWDEYLGIRRLQTKTAARSSAAKGAPRSAARPAQSPLSRACCAQSSSARRPPPMPWGSFGGSWPFVPPSDSARRTRWRVTLHPPRWSARPFSKIAWWPPPASRWMACERPMPLPASAFW